MATQDDRLKPMNLARRSIQNENELQLVHEIGIDGVMVTLDL